MSETDDGVRIDRPTAAAIALVLVREYIEAHRFSALGLWDFQQYLSAIAGDVTVDEDHVA